MATIFGKASSHFYSAFLIPDPVKRRAALDEWINSTTKVIQAAVAEELKAFIEIATENRWTDDGWIAGAKKFRTLQNSHYIVMDIYLRQLNLNEKYRGDIPTPVIPKTEIDLHGKTVDEAIPLVEEFLNESYKANVRRVRIIHGKGIGILRQTIRNYLGDHGLVTSFGPADKNYGGEGATDVEIIDLIIN